ncbi:hypothetical protein ABT120_43880 [Nonomuraea angiospora]|uniref:hypothetical protein n=1 Tax=Nonomuraea angiospora TaxID=46172 RepID=UPI00332A7AAA
MASVARRGVASVARRGERGAGARVRGNSTSPSGVDRTGAAQCTRSPCPTRSSEASECDTYDWLMPSNGGRRPESTGSQLPAPDGGTIGEDVQHGVE